MCPAASAQAQPQPSEAASSGYQWKQVFLPDGTRLRASFGGHNYFARVEGGEIKYGEHAMSPSRFANLQGSGNRNAWRAVWLCLPGSQEWVLADVCRSARQAAIARLIGDGAPAGGPPREREQTGVREQTGTLDRRVADRRMPRLVVDGRRNLDLRQPGVRVRALHPGGSGQNEPRVPVAISISGNQRKSGAGRNDRRKRIAASGLAGNP
ncbi:MAG TPA: hypothetical protein VGF27_17320 [Pseudoduganella sp.]